MPGSHSHPPLAPAALHAPPEALAREAWLLELPQSHELPHVDRDAASFLIDGLLGRVVRGAGALDVAIGERLEVLAAGDRTLRLGYSCIGDYARERLGIGDGSARAMVRLARDLRARPLLREAVRSGEVSVRKAQAIVSVAWGEAEAGWIGRARGETVRALEAAVRAAARPAGPAPATEEWERISIQLAAEDRAKVDEAMALAGRLLGASTPRWERLEAICQEYLGTNAGDEREDGGREQVLCGPVDDWLSAAKEALEVEMGRWEFLEKLDPVAAPAAFDETDGVPVPLPQRLDGELRELVAMRNRWDELVGHLAMLLRMIGLPRFMGFASFGHYCEERLGMATRTVEQRIWLERRFYCLPRLRVAMRDGRLSYEKARLVAKVADDETSEAWIARAERLPCIALRREIEAAEETQMCEDGVLDLRVPRRVRLLLDEAIRAVRMGTDRWLDPGKCLGFIAQHFVDTWKGAVLRRRSRQRRVVDRDGGHCQVPGCSRAATQVHHVVFRSAGGGNDEGNLVSLCAAHHLHGVHLGWIRVRGQAPGALTWELGGLAVSGSGSTGTRS